MIQKIIWTAIATLAIAAGATGYYLYVENSSTSISLLYDITDPAKNTVDAKELQDFLTSNISKWGSSEITIQAISNVDYNKAYTASLPAEFILLSNPAERDSEIQVFFAKVNSDLDELRGIDTGKPKSNIYIPILKETNRLASSTAKHKILIIYSDLQENSSWSIYKAADYNLLNTNPQKVKEIFMQQAQPSNLKGVDVHFVFSPQNDAGNRFFKLMSGLFAEILNDSDAHVFIGANLIMEK